MNLRFDTRQQSLLDIVQHRVVLNDGKVLSFGLELLVGILPRTSHHGLLGHLLGLHLLGNLGSCGLLTPDQGNKWAQMLHTIIATEEEDVDELKTKDTQEVPTDARHPSWIHVLGLHARLQHALELDGKREWQFHYTQLVNVRKAAAS